MWKKLNGFLARDRRNAWLVSLLLLAAIGSFDYATGIEYGFGLFYLFPVVLVTWHVGQRPGLLISCLASLCWALADYLPRLLQGLGPAQFHVTIWNAAIALGIFTAFTVALAKLKRALEHEREMLRLKSDLLSVVSHEFNNSLTTMGMALFLLRENDEVPDQRHKTYLTLERIHQILKTTVSNFLNQARMQSGRFQLDIRQIELRRLVGEVLELMRPLAEQKGIDLRLEFPETTFPVTADPDAMILVLSNLIGNAVKYTPAHGRVSVRLRPAGGDPPQEVEVSVEDTGIGIAAEDQEAIFQGFYRTGEGRKAAKGYGLGLMVCRQIMASHGSSLDVESRPGKGSRFHFRLPVCRPDCPNLTSGLCHRCRSRNPLAEARV
ncbi:MAG: HAMP domain-containing sensor histidine kinase [Elusimicrobia bacterium]|nr:HAMP domain-containing sensor histidine kinase [Elusimicrobiota bacterium]